MKGSRAFLTLALLGLVAACNDTPTAPTRLQPVDVVPVATPPAPNVATVRVSGHVWMHDAAGVRPAAGVLWGFVQTARGGHNIGPLPVDANGGYRLSIPVDGFVHLYAGDFQPCVVRVASAGGRPR